MDIVEEIRKDRENGAKRLVSEYKNGLLTLARRFCSDMSDAEELVNRTFAEVLANVDRYAEQSAFFGWMCQILSNLHANDCRRKSNANTVYPGDVPDVADWSAQEAIFSGLDHESLRDAIEQLPKDIRKAVILHYFEEMPVREVARILSTPAGTIAWRLHCAREILAAKLSAGAKKAVSKSGAKALLIALALVAVAAVGAVGVVAIRSAAEPEAEESEVVFNAKSTENTEGALTGFTGFPTEGTDPKPADPSLSSQAPATNHETNGDSPQQVEAITDNSTTNNEDNAMNTKLVKSAAVKALALGAMLMSTPAQSADYYVAKSGDDGNAGTHGAPFATIAKAITEANTAIDGGADSATIYVGDGTYAEHTLTLEKPITIVGESGNRDAVIVNANGSASNKRRAFTLNHAAATVSGITVRGGYINLGGNNQGGNILISANGGVVTNCVVASGFASGGGNIRLSSDDALVIDCVVANGTIDYSWGGNICAYRGHVSRCLVADGRATGSNEPGGDSGNVYLANSAVMENSLVRGGVVTRSGTTKANGVYLAGSSRLVNCTIVKNRSDSYPNVPAVNAGADTVRVVNCAIYGNGGTAAKEWGGANGACYVNCATASGAAITGGTGNIATLTEAAFADYAGGDYHPQKKGVLYNAGTGRDEYFAFGAESLFDLGRSDRISGARLDIGCYEFYVSGSVFYFR